MYIFPQYDGLGYSSTSKHYAIKSSEEAAAHLDHPVLGPRLRECVDALLAVTGRTAPGILLGYWRELVRMHLVTLLIQETYC